MQDGVIVLKDDRGFPIGEVRYQNGNGTGIGYRSPSFIGSYVKYSDITFDNNGRIYCHGDGLASLVRETMKGKV